MKWVGIFLLGFSMSEIYPVKDLKSGLVLAAFWFGLNFFIEGQIEESK